MVTSDHYTKGTRAFSVVFITTLSTRYQHNMYFDRFDIIEAYFLFLCDYHEGQGSDKYSRLSRMTEYYTPSPLLCYDNMTENAQMIYDDLVAGAN